MFRSFKSEDHTGFNEKSSVLSNPKFDRSLHRDPTNFGFGTLELGELVGEPRFEFGQDATDFLERFLVQHADFSAQ